MSVTSETDALRTHAAELSRIANASDDLDVAELTRRISESLAEVYSGRVENATVEESDDEIVLTLTISESSFAESEEGGVAANVAPDYEQWLRSNSDCLDDVADVPFGVTYGEWLEARGGK